MHLSKLLFTLLLLLFVFNIADCSCRPEENEDLVMIAAPTDGDSTTEELMLLTDESSEDDESHVQTGQCATMLPDGRLQTVTYICGRSSGFQTVVEYSLKEQIVTAATTADSITNEQTTTTTTSTTMSTPQVDATAQPMRRRGPTTTTFQPESIDSSTTSRRRLINIKAAGAAEDEQIITNNKNSTRNISLMKTPRTPPNRHRLIKIKAVENRSEEPQQQQQQPVQDEVSLLKTLFTNAQQEGTVT